MIRTVLWTSVAMASACAVDSLETVDTNETRSALATTETLPFPLKQIELVPDTWLSMGTHGGSQARDMTSIVHDGTAWRAVYDYEAYNEDPQNEDHLIYNVPVYSPVTGVIIGCWRNAPENIPGVEGDAWGGLHAGRTSTPRTIVGSGNHLSILTEDGRIVLLAHLRDNSIPTYLCPFDETFVEDADNVIDEFPVETQLEIADRIPIRQGEYVGRVGNNGNSSAPHLHVHIKDITSNATGKFPIVSNSRPLNWHGVYGMTRAEDATSYDLQPIVDTTLAGSNLHYASPFLLHDTATSTTSIVDTKTVALDGMVATAARLEAGGIELSSFRVGANNDLVLLDTELTTGSASALEIVRPRLDDNGFVTVIRDANNNLKLIAWDVLDNGTIVRRGEASAGAVSAIAATRAPNGAGVITAVRDSDNKLRVISWSVSAGGTIDRIATYAGDFADSIAITTIGHGVAVATHRSATNAVRFTTIAVSGWLALTYQSTTAVGTGTGTLPRIAAVGADSSSVVVGKRHPISKQLELFRYTVTATGTVSFVGNAASRPVEAYELVATGTDDVITFEHTGASNARLTAWRTFLDGRIERHGEMLTTHVAHTLSLASPFATSDGTAVVAAVRHSTGKQRLYAYQYTN